MAKRVATSMTNLFSGATQSKEIADLTEQNEELERQLADLREQLKHKGGEQEIAIEEIDPDPDQPRKTFPELTLQERAKSLREEGQKSAIILIKKPDGRYQLFDGELRWRSAPLAGLSTLRAVFMDTPNDAVEIFDGQLTTSIQSQKLHDLDLATGLIRLIEMKYPHLQGADIPKILNGVVQRLKRAKQLETLGELRVAPLEKQQAWLKTCPEITQDDEAAIISVLLSKQQHPVSIANNIFPLLKLPPDLKQLIRETGVEGSKARAIAKLSSKALGVSEQEAKTIRAAVAEEITRRSLREIRTLVSNKLMELRQSEEVSKSDTTSNGELRLTNLSKKIKQAKLWDDPDIHRLLDELETLLQRKSA
jgi:ParB family chromosome partitioning protein